MKTNQVSLIGVAASLMLLVISHTGSAITTSCLAPNSASNSMLDEVKRLATGIGDNPIRWRSNLSIPQVTDSAVVDVTDDSTCAKLAAVVSQSFSGTPPSQSVHAIQIGATRYFAWDPARLSQSGNVYVVTDQSFVRIKAFLH